MRVCAFALFGAWLATASEGRAHATQREIAELLGYDNVDDLMKDLKDPATAIKEAINTPGGNPEDDERMNKNLLDFAKAVHSRVKEVKKLANKVQRTGKPKSAKRADMVSSFLERMGQQWGEETFLRSSLNLHPEYTQVPMPSEQRFTLRDKAYLDDTKAMNELQQAAEEDNPPIESVERIESHIKEEDEHEKTRLAEMKASAKRGDYAVY